MKNTLTRLMAGNLALSLVMIGLLSPTPTFADDGGNMEQPAPQMRHRHHREPPFLRGLSKEQKEEFRTCMGQAGFPPPSRDAAGERARPQRSETDREAFHDAIESCRSKLAINKT